MAQKEACQSRLVLSPSSGRQSTKGGSVNSGNVGLRSDGPILLLGGSGYLGGFFQRELTARKTPFDVISRNMVDFAKSETLRALFAARRPKLVINLAGFTGKPNVDACESRREACWEANVELPVRIADACAATGVPMAHISSGCIYQGSPDPSRPAQGFREEDAPNFSFDRPPCSYYSGTKAEVEKRLRPFPRVYIWRLRMPFWHVDEPRNLLSKLLRYEKVLEGLNSVSQAEDFARTCIFLLEKGADFGTYNVANPGALRTSWVVERMLESGLRKKAPVFYGDAGAFAQEHPAPRSACILDTGKIQRLGIDLPDAETAIRDCLRRWAKEGNGR